MQQTAQQEYKKRHDNAAMFGVQGLTEQKKGPTINSCLVPMPHYSARPMRLGSRGPAVRLRYVTEKH